MIGVSPLKTIGTTIGVDATSVYGTPASPVLTAGTPLFAPSTARFGAPRQVQLGVRTSF